MVLLSIEQVATALGCRCRTVLRLMQRGDLHPVITVNREPYFDPKEIARIRYVPIGDKIVRIVRKPCADYNKIRDAILNKQIVTANYRGHPRVFCPHVIGTKRGRDHCLGYQFDGGSSSGLPPDGEWRCFDVNELSNLRTSRGVWRAGRSHTQPQSAVDNIDQEVT